MPWPSTCNTVHVHHLTDILYDNIFDWARLLYSLILQLLPTFRYNLVSIIELKLWVMHGTS